MRLSREAQSRALYYEDVDNAQNKGGGESRKEEFFEMFFRKLRQIAPFAIGVVVIIIISMAFWKYENGTADNFGSNGKVAEAANQMVTGLEQDTSLTDGEGTIEEEPRITVHDIAEEDMCWQIYVNHVWNVITVYTETYPGSGEFDYPYKAITVSVGLGDNTKLGTYTVGAPEGKEWHYKMQKMDGGSWCQYLVRFQETRLFHSCTYSPPIDTQDFATFQHDTLNISMFNNLGKAASHGCIRMRAGDAYWLYTHIEEGTTVIIENDYSSPGPLGKPVIQRISGNCPAPYRNWDPTDPHEDNPWLNATDEQKAEWLIDAEYENPIKPSEPAKDSAEIENVARAISLQLNSADGLLHLMPNPTYEQIKANFSCQFDDWSAPAVWNLYFEGPHDLATPGQYSVTAYAMDVETGVKSSPISVTIQVEQPVQPDPPADQPE